MEKLVPLDVKKGDEVIFSKYGGTEVKVEGEDLLILRESDILAKVATTKVKAKDVGRTNGTQGTEVQRGGPPRASSAASTSWPTRSR